VYQCGYYIKMTVITFMLTYWYTKIWNFFFVAFHLLAIFTEGFLQLHHQGI